MDFIKNLGQPTGLSGVLNGSFSISGDAQHPGGQLQLSGQQFKYRGLVIPTIRDQSGRFKTRKAELQNCRITVNQNDFIDATGNIAIATPYAYQARAEIALRDLGSL